MTDYDAEVVQQPGTAVQRNGQTTQQTVVYNPLDAEPVAFARQLETRKANYDALAMHLRGLLIPGKDFGRIHIAKRGTERGQCPKPWDCTYDANPGHWTGYELFAPGADKILNMLGLVPRYPDEDDYRRACLKGYELQDVIMKCYIPAANGHVVAEGMGSASRKEHKNNLNSTLKKACKRARVDAVKRLPGVSALFEDDFLEQLDRQKAPNPNSTAARAQTVRRPYNAGAKLTVCPIGAKQGWKDKPFRELGDDTLEFLSKLEDKPDIRDAAIRVLDERDGLIPAENPGSDQGKTSGEIPEDPPGRDDLPPLSSYEEEAR